MRVDGVEDVELEGGEVVVGAAGGEEEGGVEDGAADDSLGEKNPARSTRREVSQMGEEKVRREGSL